MSRAQQHRWKTRDRRQGRCLWAHGRTGSLKAGAKAAGVAWRDVKHWLNTDLAFRKKFEAARTVFEVDLRERLARLAMSGHGPSLRLLAQTELAGVDRDLPGHRVSRWEMETGQIELRAQPPRAPRDS